ncbi:hypothetical protein PHET_04660 [Paragonimus heterotremus]|uniref:Uncharacterized protein n=1 Tax=Paragonimus heterotremus TaxID=100268 RepID=A0A8J4TI47_9TREM|nr:hypothetical protein PHET_04660 [Paragonimus heterotremus]
MSQQTEDLYLPELSQYSTAGTASANSPVGQLHRDRELEVELARLRIQEVEKRTELERMIQQGTTLNRNEYERKSLGDLNKLPTETSTFSHATELQTDYPGEKCNDSLATLSHTGHSLKHLSRIERTTTKPHWTTEYDIVTDLRKPRFNIVPFSKWIGAIYFQGNSSQTVWTKPHGGKSIY